MGYKEQTYELLKDFKQGLIDDETFLKKLRSSEYTDLGFAMIDHERSLRQGFAEVVYCEGKTAEQTAAIMSRLAEVHSNIIGTRANEEKFAAVKKAVPDAEYYKDILGKKRNNVIVTPHIAGVTQEAIKRMDIELVNNIKGYLENKIC